LITTIDGARSGDNLANEHAYRLKLLLDRKGSGSRHFLRNAAKNPTQPIWATIECLGQCYGINVNGSQPLNELSFVVRDS
jgi:hypothetical protein